MARLAAVLAGLFLAAVLVATVVPAEASWPFGACDGRNVAEAQWQFANDWTGSRGALKQYAEDAFHQWRDSTRRWDGNHAINNQGDVFTLRWDSGLGGSLARTCGYLTHNIEFNPFFEQEFLDHKVAFFGVATHEWGHAFGLRHSGRYHGLGGDSPTTMASCVGGFNSAELRGRLERQVTLNQDDEAAIQWLTNVTTDGYRALTANPSWEEGTQWWQTSNMASSQVWSSGGGVNGSPKYVALRPNSASSHIYQANLLLTENNRTYVKARVNTRKHLSTDVGTVRLRYRYRTVTHSGTANCQFPNDVNINTVPQYGAWTYSPDKWCTPSSAQYWRMCTAQGVSLQAYPAHGWHLRVTVRPRMMVGGTPDPYYTYAHLDRTRLLAYVEG